MDSKLSVRSYDAYPTSQLSKVFFWFRLSGYHKLFKHLYFYSCSDSCFVMFLMYYHLWHDL